MSFDEVRLPEDIERGAVGGPGFNTTVLQLFSGFESRNQNWSRIKGKYDISYGITSRPVLESAINFFYARRGQLNGFRFKDWSDFQIGDPNDASTKQSIGTGDGVTTQFQIYKRYTDSGANFFDREINKIVSGTLKVYKGSVLQVVGYTIDENTGIITFTPAPAAATVISVICEFDVPVRFGNDELNIRTEVFADNAKISLPSIPIVEIRV